MEKANRAAESLARTSGDSYKVVVDHMVALQERNVRFAQGMVDAAIKELRAQAESNRAVAEELVERAEGQRDALQSFFEESAVAYADMVRAPFAYFQQGLRLVETDAVVGLSIPNYDELNVEEIKGMLDGLTAAQIREVREYEKRNKNRETLIEQFDRRLKAASA